MVALKTISMAAACPTAAGPWVAMFLILPAGFKREKSGSSFLRLKPILVTARFTATVVRVVKPARTESGRKARFSKTPAMRGKVVTVSSPRKAPSRAWRSVCFMPSIQEGNQAPKIPRNTRKFAAAMISREDANWPSPRAFETRLPVGCSVLIRHDVVLGRKDTVDQLHGAAGGLREHLREYQQQPAQQG